MSDRKNRCIIEIKNYRDNVPEIAVNKLYCPNGRNSLKLVDSVHPVLPAESRGQEITLTAPQFDDMMKQTTEKAPAFVANARPLRVSGRKVRILVLLNKGIRCKTGTRPGDESPGGAVSAEHPSFPRKRVTGRLYGWEGEGDAQAGNRRDA